MLSPKCTAQISLQEKISLFYIKETVKAEELSLGHCDRTSLNKCLPSTWVYIDHAKQTQISSKKKKMQNQREGKQNCKISKNEGMYFKWKIHHDKRNIPTSFSKNPAN